LRHRLLGTLHPIALLAELTSRQVTIPTPDLDRLRDTTAKIKQHARDATASVIDLMTWITPEESLSISLKEGIEATVSLIRTDSEVRGVRIVCAPDIPAGINVGRGGLRTLAAAALIASVDMRPSPQVLRVSACHDGHTATLRIDVQYADAAAPEFVTNERRLSWDDVTALAQFEHVELRQTDNPFVVLCRFPIVTA